MSFVTRSTRLTHAILDDLQSAFFAVRRRETEMSEPLLRCCAAISQQRATVSAPPAISVRKRKREEEDCSQSGTQLQGSDNSSAKEELGNVTEVSTPEIPAEKKRKETVNQPSCSTPRENTATKSDTFASRYIVGEKLGEGGFGSVFKGQRVTDGLQVAIKFVSKEEDTQYLLSPDRKKVPAEVALLLIMMRRPIHKGIIQLIEWFDEPERYILILERPEPSEDLSDFMSRHDEGYLNEDLARAILLQVVRAVHRCRSRGVVHRDIKLENLLINPDTLEVKVIDFGCGERIRTTGYDIFSGTKEYCPPEFIMEGKYHADTSTVWSLGVLLFAMVCGYYPFEEYNEIIIGRLHFKDGLSNECCNLIRWCLERKPKDRPSFQQIMQHEWFRCNMAE